MSFLIFRATQKFSDGSSTGIIRRVRSGTRSFEGTMRRTFVSSSVLRAASNTTAVRGTARWTSDLNAPPVTVKRSNVASTKPSPISQMPEGLINTLNREELLDLLAYLISRGDPGHPAFKK